MAAGESGTLLQKGDAAACRGIFPKSACFCVEKTRSLFTEGISLTYNVFVGKGVL
jgi:hypothetical protein